MGIKSEKLTRYRYPGTKFFEADQNDIFFGRKDETISLVHSIKAHNVFVIFADSGIGKTSLLNAGLIPEFEKENELEKILSIKIRFQDISITPIQTFIRKLSEFSGLNNTSTINLEQKTWPYFKTIHFNDNSGSKEKLPLFIFDQFEEFFNHKKSDREAFINELSDLLNQYLPDYIREEMDVKFKERKPSEEEIRYYTPPRLKMLFLIRADKLKLMDDLSKKIPLILRNRFHLKPLNIEQAKQGIVFPACLPRNNFASPAFSFEESAVSQICNYLKNDEGEVESFQLQILCQELEKRVIERYDLKKTAEAVQITENELGGETGMNDITKNYYINRINSIPDEAMRKKAMELIEDRLIVEDRRISQAEFLLLKEGYTQELLDYLVNSTRLIRIDNDRYVEISHDRLLPSILKLKQQRKEAEEKANTIQKIKENEERIKQQVQKQNEENIRKLELNYLKDKVKKAALLRFFFVLLILLFGGIFWASIKLEEARTETNMELANLRIDMQEFDAAKKFINKKNIFSVFISSNLKNALDSLNTKIDSFSKKWHSFNTFYNQADSLTNTALQFYNSADSFMNITITSIQQNNEPDDINWKFIQNNFVGLIGGENIIKAREAYESVIASGFVIKDNYRPKMNANLQIIADTTAAIFKQNIDACYLLMRIKKEDKAREAYNKANKLDTFANKFEIYLDPEDTKYLYTINKILHNEK